ncbi:amino acid/amide ABC transporter substrate-binding protein (HAAT family) [Rhodobacter aestuarii]|uniref:Amino acid/amide ABC transporter substrate-binding protein, HAAT family n=1 Tax=Rhodobacter aestuarii TaxID=453582 RepID=A0A1N7NCE1_9RHOB|nr:penicillin-binding protein activator [Rhodobacter aestuarii]PTV96376.1 amino acid/amide ABC transporter substrate-binding protein (HAAT family) [Rhodobacter aestuarii]SIS95986.1 amino acid/amide ABC transporter substrate-binding protein, HAAT family [Rhodobacter aestuarii]
MFATLRISRNPLLRLFILFSALWLAACEPIPGGGAGPSLGAGEAVPVALLVPSGSGETNDEFLATSLRQAAELAISDLNGVKIDLRIYNTGAQPAQAAAMATKAVDEGAKIILGPVYSGSANAAAVAVADRGVSVLAFSNNTDIAGGNLFVLGPTFPNTANRMASFAVSQGKRRILVVSEQTLAGQVGASAIKTAVGRFGGSVAGEVSFPYSQTDVVNAVPQIASRVKAGGVDALFITSDAGGALPLLAQMLPEQGVNPAVTKFIGLTRWDTPPAAMALPGLQGGWFALPDPNLNERFSARYQTAYGSAPHPIAGLAYDGIAAIGALVKSRNPDPLGRAALTQPSGFVGVNGIFRLRPDGTNERGLAVAEIRDGRVVVIDAAPRSFGGFGF